MIDEVEFFGGPYDGRVIKSQNIYGVDYLVDCKLSEKWSEKTQDITNEVTRPVHWYKLQINDLNGIKRFIKKD